MSDAHFASLSSTLLARKGGARPAMRPQSAVLGPVDGVAAAANLEDLGWNDMGEDALDVDHSAAAPARPASASSLAESSLIKKPALPPIDEREPIDEGEQTDGEGARVVSFGPLRNKPAAQAPNQVRESLDRIADRLDAPADKTADDENTADTEQRDADVGPVRIAAPAAPRAVKGGTKAASDTKGKRAAFTLRLDPQRHLMLRLACTVRGSSAQQLVTDALDRILDEMPEIAMLAAQVQQRPN